MRQKHKKIGIEQSLFFLENAETENQFQKTPVMIKNYTSQRDCKREIVNHQSKFVKKFNDKIEKEQAKLSEELSKINEKSNQIFQEDLKKLTEKLTTSFLKEINPM